MKTRKSAVMLVKNATTQPKATWYERLSLADKTYVCEVVDAMKVTPDVAPYLVAEAVRVELGLSINKSTIARTLKEMMNEKP